MKHLLFGALLTAACLTACSSDEKTTPAAKPEEPRIMTVDVEETPITDAAIAAAAHRAADVTTSSTLAEFNMNYQANNYNFKKTGSSWSTNTWPSGVDKSAKIDFYAYSGGTFNYNSGTPYLTFTVESAPSSQHDLLVAEHKQIAHDDAAGHVSLCFSHACAAVLFNVKISNTLHDKLKSDLTVNSIVLKNVNNHGEYRYDTKSWDNVNGSASYTLNNSDITVTTAAQQLSCGYLFMIPQQHDANGTERSHLEINYTNGTAQKATIPLAIDWQAGKLYTIDINLGTGTIK